MLPTALERILISQESVMQYWRILALGQLIYCLALVSRFNDMSLSMSSLVRPNFDHISSGFPLSWSNESAYTIINGSTMADITWNDTFHIDRCYLTSFSQSG